MKETTAQRYRREGRCTQCGGTPSPGLRMCDDCRGRQSIANKRWQDRNWRSTPEQVVTRARYKRAARYKLTTTEVARLEARAGGKCELCGRALKHINIDHDHRTGRVRGILCTSCNTGLGKLGDCISRLEEAIDYLRRTSHPDDNPHRP